MQQTIKVGKKEYIVTPYDCISPNDDGTATLFISYPADSCYAGKLKECVKICKRDFKKIDLSALEKVHYNRYSPEEEPAYKYEVKLQK